MVMTPEDSTSGFHRNHSNAHIEYLSNVKAGRKPEFKPGVKANGIKS